MVCFGVVLTGVLTDAVTIAKPFAFQHRIHNNLDFCVATIFKAQIVVALIIELPGAYETQIELLQDNHLRVSRGIIAKCNQTALSG